MQQTIDKQQELIVELEEKIEDLEIYIRGLESSKTPKSST